MHSPVEVTRHDTRTHWQRFSVPYEFPVCFTRNVFAPDNPLLRDLLIRLEPDARHRLVICIDAGVTSASPTLTAAIAEYVAWHDENLNLVIDPVVLPGGEAIKHDLHFVERVQKVLADNRIDRHSHVIAAGGGALLDAVGLVAATSHRGIRHTRLPTTVLSQNDSGVGVKNGVNLFGQKNYIGTFAPPFAVINDQNFIDTLPDRDKIAGMAEAVKVALIRDRHFYEWLESNADRLALLDPAAMRHMIEQCARLHMRQIARGGDPFETGSTRPLDFGHWAAHRLETLTRYHLRHGEAVAIGIAIDTRYSVLAGLLPAGIDERVCFLLEHLGFRLWHAALDMIDRHDRLALIQGLEDFREHLGGQLTITLLGDIGKGVDVHRMDSRRVREAIDWVRERRHDDR